MQTVLNLLEAEPIRLFLSFGVVLFLVLNLAAVLTMADSFGYPTMLGVSVVLLSVGVVATALLFTDRGMNTTNH